MRLSGYIDSSKICNIIKSMNKFTPTIDIMDHIVDVNNSEVINCAVTKFIKDEDYDRLEYISPYVSNPSPLIRDVLIDTSGQELKKLLLILLKYFEDRFTLEDIVHEVSNKSLIYSAYNIYSYIIFRIMNRENLSKLNQDVLAELLHILIYGLAPMTVIDTVLMYMSEYLRPSTDEIEFMMNTTTMFTHLPNNYVSLFDY